MSTLLLKVITPEKVVHEEEVEQVTIPTPEGYITVLPGHVPLVTLLGKGDIVARTKGEDVPFVAVHGFVRIRDNEVDILADFAEHIEHIATEEAIQSAQEAALALQEQFDKKEIVDFEHFESELARSLTRVKIGDKWRLRGYRRG